MYCQVAGASQRGYCCGTHKRITHTLHASEGSLLLQGREGYAVRRLLSRSCFLSFGTLWGGGASGARSMYCQLAGASQRGYCYGVHKADYSGSRRITSSSEQVMLRSTQATAVSCCLSVGLRYYTLLTRRKNERTNHSANATVTPAVRAGCDG